MKHKIKYTDKEIVEGILRNDAVIIEYFFFKECKKLFEYIIRNVFHGNQEANELINELYLYLRYDNWYKVRQYDYRSQLLTWISVVAIRFFQKKRALMIDSDPIETLYEQNTFWQETGISQDCRMDINNAIAKMTNERYKFVINELELKERDPEELAKEMNITIDNLYNIRSRARLQLKTIMARKEDYYG